MPCRKSIGTFTSARCAARSSDGLPAGCSGKPRNTRPRTPGSGSRRLRLRGHAPAERLAAREERHARQRAAPPRRPPRAPPRARPSGGSGRFEPRLHVGEVVAQRGDAALGEALGDRGHERMLHARAGAVREHVAARARLRQARSSSASRRAARQLACSVFAHTPGAVGSCMKYTKVSLPAGAGDASRAHARQVGLGVVLEPQAHVAPRRGLHQRRRRVVLALREHERGARRPSAPRTPRRRTTRRCGTRTPRGDPPAAARGRPRSRGRSFFRLGGSWKSTGPALGAERLEVLVEEAQRLGRRSRP